MSTTTIEFIDHLVRRFPALEPLLREHLADNFGEVLPHVFFGDLTRYVITEWERGGPDGVGPILFELESALSTGDEEIAELIAVSFLENLPRQGEPGDGIRELLGSRLKWQLEQMG
jgi:hypothetical protein